MDAEKLLEIRRKREDAYARNYQRKLKEERDRQVRLARRSLWIGNPVMRRAIELDKEAEGVEKRSDFKLVSKIWREREQEWMAAEDKRK